MNCRHCHTPLEHVFLDLGFAPPSNAYLSAAQLQMPELSYPLKLFVCDQCWLVQTIDYAAAEQLFDADYAYFSSVSQSWTEHARQYAEMITARLQLNAQSLVIEIAANDGYLLKNFVAAGIPCLGIEPTAGTAAVARALGIPVLGEFFGALLAQRLQAEGRHADLIIGNNVYAHVPDINDFTAGLKTILKPGGTITLEFPHLLRLMQQVQFDTVYHEHYSYLSLYTVSRIFARAGLRVWHVEQLATHGGSLRVYGCHAEDARTTNSDVNALLREEQECGLRELAPYQRFQAQAEQVKNALLTWLLEMKKQGKTIAAYGAAAKGNTLLNFAGVKPDLLPFVVDAAPSKQGKFLPGSHIPVLPVSSLTQQRPDVVLILPWNIADEIVTQQKCVRDWGGEFVVAVPALATLK